MKNPQTLDTAQRASAAADCIVTLLDEAYPPLLREIIDPPLALHVRGDLSVLAHPCVAIVGSRRASPYGITASSRLARDLARAGVTVVSGLARGIDAAAHEAALDAGGRTAAILGTGIDVVYPRGNKRLFDRMARDGAVLTQFGPGTPPLREHFPIRNRIISGLCHATVIVEATSRSGSLITARTAAEQGRDVLAVPGSIFAAASEGTHRLIQYGAKLVHDVDDILEELPGFESKKVTKDDDVPPEDEAARRLLEAVRFEEALHVDQLAERTGTTPALIAGSLLLLEMGGWIRAVPGSRYVRAR